MEKLEAEMLESPTWKHRKEDDGPEPFAGDADEDLELINKNMKKAKNKGSKRKYK